MHYDAITYGKESKITSATKERKDPLNFKYKVSWKQVEKRYREG